MSGAGKQCREAQETDEERRDEIVRLTTLLEQHEAMEALAAKDLVFYYTSTSGMAPALNVNDVFVHGADAVGLKFEEGPILLALYERYGEGGLMAWASRVQGGLEPLGKVPEGYAEALPYIQETPDGARVNQEIEQ